MPVHTPVLLNEVVELMHVQPAGSYIDATYGRGGHSRALLAQLGQHGRLLVVDRDPQALADAHALAASDPRVTVADGAYSRLAEFAAGERGAVDGILLDVGISSPQVDDAARGFSFRHDAPLDMRMDPRHGESAAEWIAHASETELSEVLWHYGEERRSRQIARRIVAARAQAPLATTGALAELVRDCYPYKGGRIDPATRSFQAIRIHINDELNELERALEAALGLLAPGGRLLVIAFHSLEDRLVKQRFRALDAAARQAPADQAPSFRLVRRKSWQAGAAECAANPRARSARLRVLERVA